MFEAGPTPRPSSRPEESRSLARHRVAPPSTPRKNWAVAKEPPKKFLNASRQVVCHAAKTNTRGLYHWYSRCQDCRTRGRTERGGVAPASEWATRRCSRRHCSRPTAERSRRSRLPPETSAPPRFALLRSGEQADG